MCRPNDYLHNETMMIETRPCMQCGHTTELIVDTQSYLSWVGGGLIQHAFPDWSKDKRELLITGTHPECWIKIFGEDE